MSEQKKYERLATAEDVQRAFADGRQVEVASPLGDWWPAGPFVDDLLRGEIARGILYRAVIAPMRDEPNPAAVQSGRALREHVEYLRMLREDPDVNGIPEQAAALDAAIASLQSAQSPAVSDGVMVPHVQRTAPERIYLTVSDSKGDDSEPFPDDHAEICWSVDDPIEVCVPYVRADLAAPSATNGDANPSNPHGEAWACKAGGGCTDRACIESATLFQTRMRPTWERDGWGWSPWKECSREHFDTVREKPIVHDWQHEARAFVMLATPHGAALDGEG